MRKGPIILAAILFALLLIAPTQLRAESAATGSGGNPPLLSWTNLSRVPAPPAAAGTMMVFAPSVDRLVLFGGWNGSSLNGTWELDPSTGGWTHLHPPRSPPPRSDGSLAYDSVNQRAYLFGGAIEAANGSYARL
ncbi:MAG: hypothetical protein L3J93_03525, partial [Thermoplasmata archaeon]|nr:hypothetical protein [Thermoplasmata archaeon]